VTSFTYTSRSRSCSSSAWHCPEPAPAQVAPAVARSCQQQFSSPSSLIGDTPPGMQCTLRLLHTHTSSGPTLVWLPQMVCVQEHTGHARLASTTHHFRPWSKAPRGSSGTGQQQPKVILLQQAAHDGRKRLSRHQLGICSASCASRRHKACLFPARTGRAVPPGLRQAPGARTARSMHSASMFAEECRAWGAS